MSESPLRYKSKEFEIALKECFETEYWPEPLFETGYISDDKFNTLKIQCGAIRRMLILIHGFISQDMSP